MNKPYVCHVCSQTFDALTDEQIAVLSQSNTPVPDKIQAQCPHCLVHKRMPITKRVFLLDITGDATLVV